VNDTHDGRGVVSSGEGEPSLLILGDVHARFHVVEEQLSHALTEVGCAVSEVVVLGDFGMFAPNLHAYFRREGHRFLRPVSFIDGNHEDFMALHHLAAAYADVVTHLPRASLHSFGPWRTLCLGGARYMDAWATPIGSEIRDEEIEICMRHPAGSVDIVLTHDCPTGIGVSNSSGLEYYGVPGVEELAALAECLRPRLWFFGHHHRWHAFEDEHTRFYGLPESWEGYALLSADGQVRRVDHEVALKRPPRWLRFLGIR
jgi:hypothetical protein